LAEGSEKAYRGIELGIAQKQLSPLLAKFNGNFLFFSPFSGGCDHIRRRVYRQNLIPSPPKFDRVTAETTANVQQTRSWF
jgi:hypothetical protein